MKNNCFVLTLKDEVNDISLERLNEYKFLIPAGSSKSSAYLSYKSEGFADSCNIKVVKGDLKISRSDTPETVVSCPTENKENGFGTAQMSFFQNTEDSIISISSKYGISKLTIPKYAKCSNGDNLTLDYINNLYNSNWNGLCCFDCKFKDEIKNLKIDLRELDIRGSNITGNADEYEYISSLEIFRNGYGNKLSLSSLGENLRMLNTFAQTTGNVSELISTKITLLEVVSSKVGTHEEFAEAQVEKGRRTGTCVCSINNVRKTISFTSSAPYYTIV